MTPARTMEARLASDKLLLAAGCQAAAAAMTTGVSKLASGRTGKNTNKKKKTRRSHDAEPWQAQAPFLPALGRRRPGRLPPSFARAANRVISGGALAPRHPIAAPSHTVSVPVQEHGVHRIHHDALVSPLGVGPMPAAEPIDAVICPCVSISHSQQHEAMLVAFHDKTFLPRRDARWTPMLRDSSSERRTAGAAGGSSSSSSRRSRSMCRKQGTVPVLLSLSPKLSSIPHSIHASIHPLSALSGPQPRRASIARHATPPSPAAMDDSRLGRNSSSLPS